MRVGPLVPGNVRTWALPPSSALSSDEAVARHGSVRGMGVRRVLRALTLERVDVSVDVCRDVDTPEDLAWWESRLG